DLGLAARAIAPGVWPVSALSERVRWAWSAKPRFCATSMIGSPPRSNSTARWARSICRSAFGVTPSTYRKCRCTVRSESSGRSGALRARGVIIERALDDDGEVIGGVHVRRRRRSGRHLKEIPDRPLFLQVAEH